MVMVLSLYNIKRVCLIMVSRLQPVISQIGARSPRLSSLRFEFYC